jgi:hypothetical protein
MRTNTKGGTMTTQQLFQRAVDAVTRLATIYEVCSRCGAAYDAASWSRLPELGVQEGPGMALELRNCTCGTTLSLLLVDTWGEVTP